jgi:hypothetical protein
MTYWVGRTPFDTKDQAKAFFKRLKDAAQGPLPAEDQDVVLALVGQSVPEKLREIGLTIVVKPNQISGDHAFYIQTPNGRTLDFSYTKAIEKLPSGKPATGNKMPDCVAEYGRAARAAILHQTRAFADGFWEGRGEAVCPVSGKTMTRSSSAVDHHPVQFTQILRQFTLDHSIRINTVRVRSPDGETRQFEDDALRERWADFHLAVAELRVIDRDTNSKLPKVRFEWKDIL